MKTFCDWVIYGFIALLVMLPCYTIGFVAALIWTCLQVGYELGYIWLGKTANIVTREKKS